MIKIIFSIKTKPTIWNPPSRVELLIWLILESGLLIGWLKELWLLIGWLKELWLLIGWLKELCTLIGCCIACMIGCWAVWTVIGCWVGCWLLIGCWTECRLLIGCCWSNRNDWGVTKVVNEDDDACGVILYWNKIRC